MLIALFIFKILTLLSFIFANIFSEKSPELFRKDATIPSMTNFMFTMDFALLIFGVYLGWTWIYLYIALASAHRTLQFFVASMSLTKHAKQAPQGTKDGEKLLIITGVALAISLKQLTVVILAGILAYNAAPLH
jgi:hypothetical protein